MSSAGSSGVIVGPPPGASEYGQPAGAATMDAARRVTLGAAVAPRRATSVGSSLVGAMGDAVGRSSDREVISPIVVPAIARAVSAPANPGGMSVGRIGVARDDQSVGSASAGSSARISVASSGEADRRCARLVSMGSATTGPAIIALDKACVRIGRDWRQADVALKHTKVSRLHAIATRQPGGLWTMAVVGSHGIAVNGRRFTANDPAVNLSRGDIISFADTDPPTLYTFEPEQAAVERAPVAKRGLESSLSIAAPKASQKRRIEGGSADDVVLLEEMGGAVVASRSRGSIAGGPDTKEEATVTIIGGSAERNSAESEIICLDDDEVRGTGSGGTSVGGTGAAAAPAFSQSTGHAQLVNSVSEEMMCEICTDLIAAATTLECSHTYCYTCIRDWLKRATTERKPPTCPTCRQKITKEPVGVLMLDKAISLIAARTLSSREAAAHIARVDAARALSKTTGSLLAARQAPPKPPVAAVRAQPRDDAVNLARAIMAEQYGSRGGDPIRAVMRVGRAARASDVAGSHSAAARTSSDPIIPRIPTFVAPSMPVSGPRFMHREAPAGGSGGVESSQYGIPGCVGPPQLQIAPGAISTAKCRSCDERIAIGHVRWSVPVDVKLGGRSIGKVGSQYHHLRCLVPQIGKSACGWSMLPEAARLAAEEHMGRAPGWV